MFSIGSAAFGTQLRYRESDGSLASRRVEIDFAANARSLGMEVVVADTLPAMRQALADAKASTESTVIVTHTDMSIKVGGYESWWEVPPAEVSTIDSVKAARAGYEEASEKKRWHL